MCILDEHFMSFLAFAGGIALPFESPGWMDRLRAVFGNVAAVSLLVLANRLKTSLENRYTSLVPVEAISVSFDTTLTYSFVLQRFRSRNHLVVRYHLLHILRFEDWDSDDDGYH